MREIVRSIAGMPWLAAAFIRIPFSVRWGRSYVEQQRQLAAFERLSIEAKKDWILRRMRRIVLFAERNVAFYREYYAAHGFSGETLRCFDDIRRIPVVTKSALQEVRIEDRSLPARGCHVSNTGGTSGQPLMFHLDRDALVRERAYMHALWRSAGYGPGCLKLGFRGTNMSGAVVRFTPSLNEYSVNTYLPHSVTGQRLEQLTERVRVRFLHGYPSSIYTFACQCRDHQPVLLDRLRASLRGILLGSEYPAPHYRDTIETVFGIGSLSWYGHSEMAVLAGERREAYVYEPFQSYGYVEALSEDGLPGCRLLGTSYDNTAAPFIRYDTGDLVEPVEQREGLLAAFRIAEGRIGDFVIDANNHPVSLTALIFGRHHDLFKQVQHLQIYQERPGEACIVAAVADPDRVNRQEIERGFDARDVALSFRFEVVRQPYRTSSGKVPLKVPPPSERSSIGSRADG